MSNLQVRPLPVKDFTGGITDDFINAPLNFYEEGDNLVLLQNKSLQSRPGSHIDEDTTDPQIPLGAQRISSLINYDRDNKLLVHSGARIFFRDPTAYSTLTGPTGNQVWTAATLSNHMSHSPWKKHEFLANDSLERPRKLYKDSGGTFRVRTAGLPALASTPVVTPGAGARTYLYAFHYSYEYTAGDETFQDAGPTILREVENADEPSTTTSVISAIPVLANSTTENWDTTVIKVEIFRTIDGGTTLFKIGDVTNGTTTFNDTFSDAIIGDNETIYTNDDSLDYDPPPLAKYVHVVGGVGYYAFLKEGTDILEYDIQQSIPASPDKCPADLRDTLDDQIKGISSVQSIPIALCRDHIYRIEGLFDAQGRGGMTHVRIHDTAGCVSHNSIVQAEELTYWAGNDGFYATDGYVVLHISDHFNDRYAKFLATCTDPENIVGAYDEKNGRIKWTFQNDEGLTDNNMLFCIDLRNSVQGKQVKRNSSFRTWSGGTSFRPTAITYFNDELVRGDTRGYVMIHSETDKDDKMIDVAKLPALWVNTPVAYTFKHVATDFGSNLVRKWVSNILITARNVTNVSIGLFAINDDNGRERVISPIRYRRNLVWGDPEFVWGDNQFVWNAAGLIKETRRMPRKGLRCHYMQVKITNAFTIITRSDNLGTATYNPALKTLLLDNAAVADWPLDSEGYFVSFEQDDYTALYEVTIRTDDTLTLLDPASTGPNSSTKWQLHGVRKGEVLNLLDFTLSYGLLTDSHTSFEVGDAGKNV